MNSKSYMIISINTEKAFDTIQHYFLIKTQIRLSTERTYFKKKKKAVFEKPDSQHHTKTGEKIILYNLEQNKQVCFHYYYSTCYNKF